MSQVDYSIFVTTRCFSLFSYAEIQTAVDRFLIGKHGWMRIEKKVPFLDGKHSYSVCNLLFCILHASSCITCDTMTSILDRRKRQGWWSARILNCTFFSLNYFSFKVLVEHYICSHWPIRIDGLWDVSYFILPKKRSIWARENQNDKS